MLNADKYYVEKKRTRYNEAAVKSFLNTSRKTYRAHLPTSSGDSCILVMMRLHSQNSPIARVGKS